MTDAERKKAFEKARAVELKARALLLATTREDVIKLLNEALAEIKALLADMPTEYEMYRLPMLQKQIEQTLVTFGNNSAELLAQGATQAWAGGQSLATTPLEAAGIRIAASLPALDTRLLMAMSNFMVDRIQDVSAQAAAKIKSQLGLVLIGAQSPGEAVSTITDVLGEESRERAITITRTELGRVHAVAAQQRMEQAAEHVPGLQKQWRRSGKIHSRENHDAIDGQIQPVNKPFALVAKKDGLPLFMMHPHDPAAPAGEVINCGCVAIPFKNDWKVLNPGKMPYSALELQHDPNGIKRAINDSIQNPVKIVEVFDPSQQRDKNGRWTKTGSAKMSVHTLAQQSMQVADRKIEAVIGTVDAATMRNKTGFDLAGHVHVVDNYAVRHTMRKHGNPDREAMRGQIAVTLKDFNQVGKITSAPDHVFRDGKNGTGRDVIVFAKVINGIGYRYVGEIRPGRKQVAMDSMRKKKGAWSS